MKIISFSCSDVLSDSVGTHFEWYHLRHDWHETHSMTTFSNVEMMHSIAAHSASSSSLFSPSTWRRASLSVLCFVFRHLGFFVSFGMIWVIEDRVCLRWDMCSWVTAVRELGIHSYNIRDISFKITTVSLVHSSQELNQRKYYCRGKESGLNRLLGSEYACATSTII